MPDGTAPGLFRRLGTAAEKVAGRFGMSPVTFWQFIRYILCGVTAFSCELFSFWVLEYLVWPQIGPFETRILGVPVTSKNISSSVAMTIGYLIAFTLNRVWSFKSKVHLWQQFFKSFLLFLFNILASNLLINLFVDTMGIGKLPAKVLQMAIIVMWNFILYKKVIYT